MDLLHLQEGLRDVLKDPRNGTSSMTFQKLPTCQVFHGTVSAAEHCVDYEQARRFCYAPIRGRTLGGCCEKKVTGLGP